MDYHIVFVWVWVPAEFQGNSQTKRFAPALVEGRMTYVTPCCAPPPTQTLTIVPNSEATFSSSLSPPTPSRPMSHGSSWKPRQTEHNFLRLNLNDNSWSTCYIAYFVQAFFKIFYTYPFLWLCWRYSSGDSKSTANVSSVCIAYIENLNICVFYNYYLRSNRLSVKCWSKIKLQHRTITQRL